MPVANISNLTVRYGAKTALTDVSVEVPEGCIGLLGPNGAGKTTLLKTLLGFVQPSSGSAQVLDLNVATQGLGIRQRIGLMSEMDCHIPGMNAVTFVSYAGELAGMPRARALSRAHEVLEYCGLGEARYRNVETYSTGMKQRIKLAQALVHGPKLIFLDEPTNGLDPAGRDEMLNLIRDISHGKGVNVLVSSHLLPDIERTCDSVIVMRGGKVVEQGDIESLRRTASRQVDVELRLPSEAFVVSAKKRGLLVMRQFGSQYRFQLDEGLLSGLDIGTAPTVAVTENGLGRLLFESARESGAQVRGFHTAQRSLEDIFMEAVQ